MDGGLLVKTACGMAPVIHTLVKAVPFKGAVDRVCPGLPPKNKLLLAVPALGNRILPAVFGAFGMLGDALIKYAWEVY